ncbi:MAG: carboxypeptidase-like regulatory domain-containing protein [Rhodothermales bacterium]|nr:carboxypeptidase-like regulatory domain-containing protein [Rhodothermales bacterium]
MSRTNTIAGAGMRTLVLLLLLVAALPVREAAAQDATYTFAWRGTPLDETLRQFQAAADLNIVWLPILVEGKRVYCVARDERVEGVLQCILRGTGLDFYRRSSGTYVIEAAIEAPPLWGNMRGIVVDSGTGQPVPSAHVYLAEAQRGRVANESGMFAFDRLLPGEYAVQVSHIGYQTTSRQIVIEPGGSVRPEIELTAQAVLLAPLVLEGLAMQPSSTVLGFALAEQEDLTSGLGTANSLQGLDALMGVRVNDATGDVHIQGGDAGEHQFRLDGAPVFIPLNVASFIGPFSPFALGSIRINKAGFGAPLGSHISGVIEARHDLRYALRGLNPEAGFASRSLVQADPLSINARFSGVHAGRDMRATVMGASRIGLWSLSAPRSLSNLLDDWNLIDSFLLSAFAERNTPFDTFPPIGSPSMQFGDLHLAGEVKRNLQTLGASLFLGGSQLGNDLSGIDVSSTGGIVDIDSLGQLSDVYFWRTATAQVSYDAVLSARSLGSLQARYSRYGLRHDFVARDQITLASPEDDGNRVSEAGLSAGIDYTLSDRHYAEAGIEAVLTSDRVRIAGSQQLPLEHSFSGWRFASFVQDKMQVGRHAVLEMGSRFTYLAARKSLYAEPRLAARLDFPGTRSGDWSFYLGSGIYRQFVNQFDVSSRSPRTFVSSTRFWMAVDSSVAPPKSGHLTGEVLWRPAPRWTVSAESHYKRHYHILALDYAASTDVPNLAQSDFLRSSSGSTRGYSLVLKRSFGLSSLQARYEYTDGRRRIQGTDRLLTVPWGEPHRVELSTNVMPRAGMVLLARWRMISGRTWGFRQAYYDFLGAYSNDLDRLLESTINTGTGERIRRQAEHYALTEPDTHKLPDLVQLDVGAGYSFELGPVGMQARLDVINLLGRTNTADWRFVLDKERYYSSTPDSGILDRGVRELLPRVVTFAVRASW